MSNLASTTTTTSNTDKALEYAMLAERPHVEKPLHKIQLVNRFWLENKGIIDRFSDKYRLEKVTKEDSFGNWLGKPNMMFGGKKPEDLIVSGQESEVLEKITGMAGN